MKRSHKKKQIIFIVPKFVYSTIYNIKSFQIKCGVMSDTFKVCVNLFDYKTGSSLSLTINDYHMMLCKLDNIIQQIEDLREQQRNNIKAHEEKEPLGREKKKSARKSISYQLTDFLRMKCRLNDGEEKNIKLTIEHVYTKHSIQISFEELLDLDLLKFNILNKINGCTQLVGNIVELYDWYLDKCCELNVEKLSAEYMPDFFLNSKNSHIFETIFSEMHINMRSRLLRDISYKTGNN